MTQPGSSHHQPDFTASQKEEKRSGQELQPAEQNELNIVPAQYARKIAHTQQFGVPAHGFYTSQSLPESIRPMTHQQEKRQDQYHEHEPGARSVTEQVDMTVFL